MPNYGFSAYLKLVCLSERAQKTEVRNRLTPSTGGFDFHRSLRLAAQRFLVEGASIAEVMASTHSIQRTPERNSAQTGLARLSAWRRQNPGAITEGDNLSYSSPNNIFSVSLNPNFYIQIGDHSVATHIWNTQRPPLLPRQVYAALSLFPGSGTDLAVLSLRQPILYRLSEAEDHSEIGRLQVLALERTFQEISDELGITPPARRDPPTAPTPSPF